MSRLRQATEYQVPCSNPKFSTGTHHLEAWQFVLLASVFSCLLLLVGCGGGSSSDSNGDVAISLSPTAVTLPVNTSQQFTGTVTGSSNTNVTWQVNGTTGGSATFGTISTAGLYTAPSAVPSSTITVTAISQADTTKTASATVTTTNANKIVVSPSTATISAGGQQTFSATLGSSAVDAAWSLSCSSSATGACGTISATGVYTAPLAPPPGQSVTVTASSKNNTASPANGNITITFGSGTLFGSYSFTISGVSGGQPFKSAGSLQFDGKGGITGGVEDRFGIANPINITGGTYTSDAQGRISATIHTDSGDETWQISLVNHTRALLIRVDSVIAQGSMDLQDAAQFGRSPNGNFSFQLAGTSAATVPVTAIVGALAFDQQGNVTAGVLDSNNGGTISTNQSVSGSATASSSTNGRGTLSLSSSLGAKTFAYYLTSATSANLIEIDGSQDLLGKLLWRTSATVDPAQFAGNFAFVFSGANSAGTVGLGGTFTTDVTGKISNGTLDIATDTAFSLGLLFSGSVTVADQGTGRSLVTLSSGTSTFQFVVYPPSPDGAVFLEVDSQNVTSGLARTTTATGSGIPSISGQFALLTGETSNAVHRTTTGSIALASRPTGTLDVNDNGTVTLGTALQNSSFSVTSLFGRGQFLLQAGTYNATYTTYIVDNNNVLMLQSDGKGVLTGLLQKQF